MFVLLGSTVFLTGIGRTHERERMVGPRSRHAAPGKFLDSHNVFGPALELGHARDCLRAVDTSNDPQPASPTRTRPLSRCARDPV